jgi:hypothetical protein
MDSISRAVHIASPQPLEAEKKVASQPGGPFAQAARKASRGTASNGHASMGPFGGRPFLRKEHHFVSRRAKSIGKTPKVSLGSASLRIATPNDANSHVSESKRNGAGITA